MKATGDWKLTELIGGHEGYDVVRIPMDPALGGPADAKTMVVHIAKDELNADSLVNEELSLRAMLGSGLAPEWLVTRGDGPFGLLEVYETDLGTTAPSYEDGEVLRWACVRLIAAIRARGLRHGDLSNVNLIVSADAQTVAAIDWQESHLLSETAPQKSPFTDSWMMMNFLKGHLDHRGIADTPRIARRWQAVLGDLGAHRHDDDNPLPLQGRRFVDLGCFQGDFVALAAADGMDAHGYDMGGFRSGENSVEIGSARWSGQPWEAIGGGFNLEETDLFEVFHAGGDVAMCFSTWIYMVQQAGEMFAQRWLRRMIGTSEVLYFETQLAGDGPGPEWLPNDEAVEELLRSMGGADVKPIITVPVWGRPAERTVWAVR